MENGEERRSNLNGRRHPEDRIVRTLQGLQKVGMHWASVILVAFFAAILWWALIYQPKNDKTREYSLKMIELVTNIQTTQSAQYDELKEQNKRNAAFRIELMMIIDQHTRSISQMETLLISLGYWPIDQLSNGNFQFQPPSVRKRLFNEEFSETQ